MPCFNELNYYVEVFYYYVTWYIVMVLWHTHCVINLFFGTSPFSVMLIVLSGSIFSYIHIC